MSSVLQTTYAEKFENWLCGLVQIKGNAIYVTGSNLLSFLSPKSQADAPEVSADIGDGSVWYKWDPNPHSKIWRFCLDYLLDSMDSIEAFLTRDPQVVRESIYGTTHNPADPWVGSDSSPQFYEYAVAHWYSHFQCAQVSSESEISGQLTTFLDSQSSVNLWLRLRRRFRDSSVESSAKVSCPTLKDIARQLHVSTLRALELSLLTVDNQKMTEPNAWHSLALTVSQCGDAKSLIKIHEAGFIENESILKAMFETGADGPLSELAGKLQSFVRPILDAVLHNVIKLGNRNSAVQLIEKYGDTLDLGSSHLLLLHTIASNESLFLPESLLTTQKRYISYRDDSLQGRAPIHQAAACGNVAFMSWLLTHCRK